MADSEMNHTEGQDQGLYEGPRAQRLRQIMERSVAQVVKTYSYEKVARAFPSVTKKESAALRSAHGQVVQFLDDSIKVSFRFGLEMNFNIK